MHVTDPAQLDGLTPDARSAAALAAGSRGLDGHLLQAYATFRGRAPDVTPLLVRRGLQG